MESTEADLENLAESFSSDVINEAISEIIAEEDVKVTDDKKWYRQRCELTPTAEMSDEQMEAEYESTTSGRTSCSTITQHELSLSLEKVSPILTPRLGASGRESSSADDVPHTSYMLKDIPGYVSPNTRQKILNDAGFGSRGNGSHRSGSQRSSSQGSGSQGSGSQGSGSQGSGSPVSGSPGSGSEDIEVEGKYGSDEEMLTTLICDDMQDTVHEESFSTRKNSQGSYSDGLDDRSSKSNSSKLRSDGTSSVGSTTVFNSIASGVFSHKRHMSPLLDMSGRSTELKKSPGERSGTAVSGYSSTKSSPRDFTSRTSGSFKLQDSPRDLHSQISSATEYETLPNGRKDSPESPGPAAHLMLSPDLAQRVSDILSQSVNPPPAKLRFSEVNPVSSIDSSINSSPREFAVRKERLSTDTSLTLSQDELDKHVSNVLQRSSQVLDAGESPRPAADHSYLDKYMSPQNNTSERFNMHPSPPERFSGRPLSSDRLALRLSPRLSSNESSPREYVPGQPRVADCPDSTISSQSDSSGQINRKYMDESSRQVLEQAADEYYRTLRKTDKREDNSRSASRNKNDSGRLNNTSGLSEELAHLVDTSVSPKATHPATDSKHTDSRPPRGASASLSEADTQSLVAKRLDRIEFMVLSALNEVPPQNRPSYISSTDHREDNLPAGYVQDSAINRPSFDSRDVIKKAEVRSPLASLPNYTLDEQPSNIRKQREESFNVSISPVRKEPFTAFNRAQDLLAERLTQRSNERTPGRRLSRRSYAVDKSSPTQSPTRDSSYPSADRRGDFRSRESVSRGRGLENIPEPLPLEIEEAGRSPPDDLIQRKRSKGRSHSVSSLESATTVESSHPESDDAQPPKLPKEAYGSRREPIKSTPGIYGTRAPKSKSSDGEITPRANSAISRAEEVLMRGEEIRGQIQARCDERSRKKLVSAAEDKSSTRRLPSPVRSLADSLVHERNAERIEDRPEHYVEVAERSALSGADRDVPLDFYHTPPRVGRTSAKEPSRSHRADVTGDSQEMKPKEPMHAWEERANGVRSADAERSRRGREADSLRGTSPIVRCPRSRSLSHSPSPTRSSAAVDSPTLLSPRLEASRRAQQIMRDSQRSPPAVRRVRPLEKVDQPNTEEFRTKLSHAVNDRLTTYHILREELMKAEDDAKGRDLNLAWQRISKRKPRAPSELDESCTTTATSTASSEMFDEQKMDKLKSLLHNPLGHLVSKSKKSQSRPSTRASKYDKLMSRIERQRKEESLPAQSLSNTTLASSDDTFCSRCDKKRWMKRVKKLQADRQSTEVQAREVPSSSDCKSDSCSTRPVTPTGLPVPCIQSQALKSSPPRRPEEKRLKDVGVMFPSPSTDAPAIRKTRKSKQKEDLPRKQRNEMPAEKEAVAWFVDDKRDSDKGRNAFEKSRTLDTGQEGLVWFVPYNDPRPWSKCPKERKAFSVSREPWTSNGAAVQTAAQKRDVNNICEAFNEATGRTGYAPTLQEAFRERNRKFISASRERQRRMNLRSEERQITKVHDEQRARLFDIQPHNYRPTTHKKPDSSVALRRAIPKEEMYDRTNRKYRVLPEVKNREKQSVIQRERVAYRLKAKLFNKKVQRHVLDQARITNLVGHRKSHHKRS